MSQRNQNNAYVGLFSHFFVFCELGKRKMKLFIFCFIFRFGQFISSTLPTFAVCEKFVVMEINNEEKPDVGELSKENDQLSPLP